jgi:diamine N-acetyltransferase
MKLRPLRADDIDAIDSWPPYPAEFGDLDYALRVHGWINEYSNKPATWIYVAEDAGERVGFSILSQTDPGRAEFRIALHPGWIGRGVGRPLARKTIDKGFAEHKFEIIHLIVRPDNPRAVALYESLGFAHRGERELEVNGRPARFLVMEIGRDDRKESEHFRSG